MEASQAVQQLDRNRLDHELARRGITAKDLAAAIGVPESTISQAHHGRLVRTATLRHLAEGLAKFPVIAEVEHLLADPVAS